MNTAEPTGLLATSITIMAPNPHELAEFYARLLGVPVADSDDNWAQLHTERMTINVEREAAWTAPVWPARVGEQTSTQHIDIRVGPERSLDEAQQFAVECGARPADSTPHPEEVRVMFDPAGHPFCLFQ